MEPLPPNFFNLVYQVVRRIPPGKVATYGQIARLMGIPSGARQVGWALADLPHGSDVPWQRVVNAQGRVSLRGRGEEPPLQQVLLEAEGVAFDSSGRIDLKVYGWSGLDFQQWLELQGR